MSLDENQITLESLKQIFGAKNVCGARCGQVGIPHCRILCGDNTASCYRGYCIYL